MSQSAGDLVAEIAGMFVRKGGERYSEAVSQAEHALQCAQLAEAAGGDSALIVAALLHDIGHLLQKVGVDAAERGIDDRHEDIGAAWLARHFVAEVSEPVRLHVDAKRYLCAVEPDYFGTLSPASVRSLSLQGGPMGKTKAAAFRGGPHADAAVSLRCWDEGAKEPGRPTPGFGHYADRIRATLRA